MRIRRFLMVCAVVVLAVPSLADAQDTRKVGVTMAYPASIGVLWHTSKTVAIRPELTFGGSSTTSTSSALEIHGDGWNIGTGVSVLFYLRTYDHLRTYIAPRFTYNHTSNTSETSSFISELTSSSITTTGDNIGGFGSFGAQYMLGDRFSVFGEVGFGFAHTSQNSSSASPAKANGNTWGMRSGVGVVFYP